MHLYEIYGYFSMHLTYHTDYALRLLMLLAVEDARLHTIAEIARRYGVSRNHMMKISRTLVAAGFITPVRGRNGGLKLAAPAEKINLGAVISVTEDNFNLVECFDAERNSCVISANCGLRNPLRHALQAFLETLRKYTLQDLITIPGSYKDLRTLFGTEIAP